jgi:hypothetical protein
MRNKVGRGSKDGYLGGTPTERTLGTVDGQLVKNRNVQALIDPVRPILNACNRLFSPSAPANAMVRFAMELYPVRSVFGFPEIFWMLRQWVKRSRAAGWTRITASVEGYELLEARGNGWFVIFYSYAFDEHEYAGEYRIWILFSARSHDIPTRKIIHRFPHGGRISVRVNPQNPRDSIADLADL